MTLATVGLFYRDVQIAAAAGGVEIVNLKRAGGHGVLIDNVAILANHHLGVTVRRAAYHRGITALAVRQHVAFGSQLCASVRDAVENVGLGAALPHGQFALQPHDIALGIGIDRGQLAVVLTPVRIVVPGAVITHAPGTGVKAGAQINKLAAVVRFPLLAGAALAGVNAIVQDARCNPFVILFRIDIATGHLAQRRLGNTQQ